MKTLLKEDAPGQLDPLVESEHINFMFADSIAFLHVVHYYGHANQLMKQRIRSKFIEIADGYLEKSCEDAP
jgi:hypothetical protein